MNTDKIAYFINHPESISAVDVTTIKEVKDKFPYSSTLHMLYIKALAASNNVHFEEELKKSAIHVNDREKLHDLIHSTATPVIKKVTEPIVTEIKTIEISKPIETVPEVKEQIEPVEIKPVAVVEEIKEEIKKVETAPVIEKIIPTIIKPVPVIPISEKKPEKVDMAKIIEDIRLKAEAARNKTKTVEPEITTPVVPVVEKIEVKKEEILDIKTPVIEKKFELDTKEDVQENPTEEIIFEDSVETKIVTEIVEEVIILEEKLSSKKEPKIDFNINSDIIQESKTIEVPAEIESAEQTLEQKPLELDVMAHAMEIAFELDVDNIIKNQVEEEVIELTTKVVNKLEVKPLEIQQSEIKNPNELSFTDWLKYKQGNLKLKEEIEEPESIKLSKTEIDDLLNKFIEEEPKMSRPQKEFYNPVKNAKKSLDDTTVLVSETLAKIYWMQKNYDKAIKAYEQLSLRNPEKKTFFANQIKKIKKEIN